MTGVDEGRISISACSPSAYRPDRARTRNPSSGSLSGAATSISITADRCPAMVSVKSRTSQMCPVDGSNMSILDVMTIVVSVLFITDALITALSPVRRNRGRLGCTMTGLLEIISRAIDPVSISWENASAHSCHVVLASGAVNEYSRCPLASVVSIGSNRAIGSSGIRYVSASFCRSSTSAFPASADEL